MQEEWIYRLNDFWRDSSAVGELWKNRRDSLLFSLDAVVFEYFDKQYGVNPESAWKRGKFFVVNVYITNNRHALCVGDLGVAATYSSLVSQKLSGRVFAYVVENDITTLDEMPVPEYFIHP